MIVFRGRLSFPKLDVKKYTQALETQVETQMRQAAREWLRAVIPKVPIWTGTSQGTLQPLGRFLRFAIPITPVVNRPGKGPEVGANQSGFKFERRGHRFVFKFDTSVEYFIRNNFYNLNPPFHLKTPGPYGAFEAGEAAFKRYLKEIAPKRIPKIKDFIRVKTQVFGR